MHSLCGLQVQINSYKPNLDYQKDYLKRKINGLCSSKTGGGFEKGRTMRHMEACLHYKHITHLVSPLHQRCIMMYVHQG